MMIARSLGAQDNTHADDAYDPLVQGALLSAPLGVPSSSLNQLQVPVIPPTPTTTTQGSPSPPSSETSVTSTFMTTTSPTTATETAHATTTSTTATPSTTHGPTSDACTLKAVYSITGVFMFLFMYAIV